VVVAGPTVVGKTAVGIRLAKALSTEIISCDSRQFYRELSIGTAKPTEAELAEVKHHFISNLSIHEYYNVSKFENEALTVLEVLFQKHDIVFMVGGSGLYIDAVTKGIDDQPDAKPETRKLLKDILENDGIEKLQDMLQKSDPEYYDVVDKANPARIMRALEVCIDTGKTFTELRLNQPKQREFNMLKIAINLPRELLFKRIETRVDAMIKSGLIDEARRFYSEKESTALKTVGYRELFEYFDGKIMLEQAITDIKTNTRRYAKRQLTWLKRDQDYYWFAPDSIEEIIELIKDRL
jgi:tRNA dimethylallyltransferase